MKNLIFSSYFICIMTSWCFSQTEGQVWIETGLKTRVAPNVSVNAEINNRIGSNGLSTSFTQFSLKYKLLKWLNASVDYRIISKKQTNQNYLHSNRINTNLNFSHKLDRLYGNFRLRYQHAFGRLFASDYEPDFDNAIRFRPKIKYDIENSIFTPHFSCEFYYNPSNSPLGKRFNKIRTSAGIELELDGPHDVGFQIIYDNMVKIDHFNAKNPNFHYDLGFLVTNVPPNFVPPLII